MTKAGEFYSPAFLFSSILFILLENFLDIHPLPPAPASNVSILVFFNLYTLIDSEYKSHLEQDTIFLQTVGVMYHTFASVYPFNEIIIHLHTSLQLHEAQLSGLLQFIQILIKKFPQLLRERLFNNSLLPLCHIHQEIIIFDQTAADES